MDNQYNYYNQENAGGSYHYSNPQSGPHGPEYDKSDREKKTGKKLPKAIAVTGLALLFGIVSSATFLTSSIIGTRVLGLNKATVETSDQSTQVSSPKLSTSTSVVTSDVSGIVEEVMPSIVSITSMGVKEVQSFFGGTYQQKIQGAGTGIIIDQNEKELQIVTNNHVVEGSTELTVTFCDETSVEASIKGLNAEYDIAVISVPIDSIEADTLKTITLANLGNSDKLKVGEPAIAIGNALGYGQSVTTGCISAINRSVSNTDAQTGAVTESSVKLIQTDAAINPGNSGGALVNASGQVIGINSSKLVGTNVEGVGYAIPISDVKDLIEELMSQEAKVKVDEDKQGVIGIEGLSVSDAFSQQLNMPQGVYVSSILNGSGAEKAGMTKGCIITAINGSSVGSMDELKNQLQYYEAGTTVTLTLQIPQTDGTYQEQTLDVTLGKKSN